MVAEYGPNTKNELKKQSKNKAEWYVLKKQELLFGQQRATHLVVNGLGI